MLIDITILLNYRYYLFPYMARWGIKLLYFIKYKDIF